MAQYEIIKTTQSYTDAHTTEYVADVFESTGDLDAIAYAALLADDHAARLAVTVQEIRGTFVARASQFVTNNGSTVTYEARLT